MLGGLIPVAGIGAILAQWALKKPIQKMFQFEMSVDGTWDEPLVKRVTRNRDEEATQPKPVSIAP